MRSIRAAATLLALGIAVTQPGCIGTRGIEDPDAERELFESLGSTTFAVYPPIVRNAAPDGSSAADIASFLISEGYGEATVMRERIPVPAGYSANELALLRETATHISGYLQQTPVGAEFVVVMDYVLSSGPTAQCVHVYIFTEDGRIACARAFNARSEAFRAASPRTTSECTWFAVDMLRQHLGRDES